MNYDTVCANEEIEFYRRFIPFSSGSPKPTLTCDDQYKRANIVFFSDSHIDFFEKEECIDNVKRTVDFINDAPVTYDAVIHAGDVITPFGKHPKEKSLESARAFFDIAENSKAPFIFSKGNHDLNDWFNVTENVFSDSDWGKLFFDFAEEKYGIVRQKKKSGDKSTWHYYDIEDKKIRIVSIDSQDTDKRTLDEKGEVKFHGGVSWYVSNEQMNWVANSALNFDEKEEKDWGVIFVMHQFVDCTNDHECDILKLLRLCRAFNEGGTYDEVYKNEKYPFFNLDVHADFTRYKEEKKPHMICWLLGHNHQDKNTVCEGINLIWTLNNSATTVCSDARVARIKGTSTQNAFDVLNIDTRHRKIRVFRYGAGKNCYGVGGDRFSDTGLDY